MRTKSVPVSTPQILAQFVETRRREKELSSRQLAADATIDIATLEQLQAGHKRQHPISLWVLVGLADAIGDRVAPYVEAANPGFCLNVKESDIAVARETVTRRLAVRRRSQQQIVINNATGVSGSPPHAFGRPATTAVAPTTLEMMLAIRELDDEERLLVKEFISTL